MQTERGVSSKHGGGLEIIDCVLSIFFFEITRLFRQNRALYSKDQIQFKILYFFSRLKLSKVIDTDLRNESDVRCRPKARAVIDESSEEEEGDDDLCGLIRQMKVEVVGQLGAKCVNCKSKVRENLKFKNLYKALIEDIIKHVQ